MAKTKKQPDLIKPIEKKYVPMPCFFTGFGKQLMEDKTLNIVAFDKDEISGETVILYDIALYEGSGSDLFPESNAQAFQVIVERENKEIGTFIIAGQYISENLAMVCEDRKKILPAKVIFVKKRAWSLRSPKE